MELEDSQELQQLIHGQQGHHAARTFMGSKQPTCLQGRGRSEIDHIFVSPTMLQEMVQASVLPATVVPSHRPVSVSFRAKDAQERCCIPLPSQLPDVCAQPIPAEGKNGVQWSEMSSELWTALTESDTEAAWKHWNARWESLLLCRGAQAGGVLHTAMTGRGGRKQDSWRVPQRAMPHSPSIRSAKLRHLIGILQECSHRVRKHEDPADLLPALHRRWRDIAEQPLEWNPEDPALLQHWIMHFKAELEQEQKRNLQRRRERWKAVISGHGGQAMAKAAWFVTQKIMRPLQFVLTDQGKPLVRWWDQDLQLRQSWQPISMFDPWQTDAQVVQQFTQTYAHLIPQQPEQPLPPLTGEMLRQAAARHKSRTAAGACGWRKQELMWLPMTAWNELAYLLQQCEAKHVLPQVMKQTWISMIPKANAAGPMDLRPIGVTSLVYRTWAKAKRLQLHSWYQANVLPEHYGAVPHRSAEQVLGLLSVQAQAAMQNPTTPLYSIKLDFSKFFDTLPWGVLETMLLLLGADHSFLATYLEWLRSTWCRYKLPYRALGVPWQRQRGLTQGCPLSPACSNILTIPFVRDLQACLKAEGLQANIYVYSR